MTGKCKKGKTVYDYHVFDNENNLPYGVYDKWGGGYALSRPGEDPEDTELGEVIIYTESDDMRKAIKQESFDRNYKIIEDEN